VTDEPRSDEAVDEAGPAAAGPAGSASEETADGTRADEPTESAAAGDAPVDDVTVEDVTAVDASGADASSVDVTPETVTVEEMKADEVKASEVKAAEVDAQDGQLDELRSGLDELTRDLQRVTAEYANYRKRVDRDRTVVAEQATGSVLLQLLPVLDDLDRARSHGDLVGPFAAVADQLNTVLGKFGLTAFGDVGDPFDPQLHEAVAHTSSPDVTETACVEIMRRGYLLGERLLRPALVAVADPE